MDIELASWLFGWCITAVLLGHVATSTCPALLEQSSTWLRWPWWLRCLSVLLALLITWPLLLLMLAIVDE